MDSFDAIVIGAGAAGLMCAMTAGQRGRRVLLLDQSREIGAKILISGGGRCNFTNLGVTPDRFLSANPHFCKSALAQYRQTDFIALVEKHGIAYHEKTLGQLFCDGSARQIVEMLLAECTAAGVDIRTGHRITDISRSTDFDIATDIGDFTAASVVLATGGLSIPKLGATGFAYDMAQRFGLSLVEPRPGLVPLKVTDGAFGDFAALAGLSVEAIVNRNRQRFRENILFTHRGLSGPAILQISSYWQPGDTLGIDLAPDLDAATWLKDRKRGRPKAETATILAEILPARLAAAMVDNGFPDLRGKPVAEAPDRSLGLLAERLQHWTIQPKSSEGWAKAEVTCGGVDTACLNSATMAARDVPGLHVIGEAVDVTGWLGGYNFQWAWSSGWCAGQAV